MPRQANRIASLSLKRSFPTKCIGHLTAGLYSPITGEQERIASGGKSVSCGARAKRSSRSLGTQTSTARSLCLPTEEPSRRFSKEATRLYQCSQRKNGVLANLKHCFRKQMISTGGVI